MLLSFKRIGSYRLNSIRYREGSVGLPRGVLEQGFSVRCIKNIIYRDK